jgi:hypothetical protein
MEYHKAHLLYPAQSELSDKELPKLEKPAPLSVVCARGCSLFGWLVADDWCWFVLREKYCWLVAAGWFVLREKYCWLVVDKPSEQGVGEGETSVVCARGW